MELVKYVWNLKEVLSSWCASHSSQAAFCKPRKGSNAKYKLFLVLHKCLTALIPLRLGHINSFAIPVLAVQRALKHLGTLTLAVTLAEVTRIAKLQKRSYCFNLGRIKRA